MRKSKKPAIASEWRESKQAQDRADMVEEKAVRDQARQEALTRVTGGIHRLFAGFAWILAGGLGLFIGLALWSYSPTDSGFSVTGSELPSNLAGLVGAWIADFLYWSLGWSSWWIVVGLVIFSAQCVRAIWAKHDEVKITVRHTSALLGLILLCASSVGVEALQLGYLGQGLPLGAGGLAGQLLVAFLTPYLGVWGTTIILLGALAAGMALVFGFAWFALAERIGQWAEALFHAVFSPPAAAAAHTAEESKPVQETASAEQPDDVQPAVLKTAPRSGAAKASKAVPGVHAGRAAGPTPPEADGRVVPALNLLVEPPQNQEGITQEAVQITSRLIESKLKTYRINANVVGAQAGPVITQYWLELAPGVKGSQVEDIRKDLTRALAVHSVRVVPVIPGKPYLGLEIPNSMHQRLAVYLREIIGSAEYAKSASLLTLAFGKDIAGKPVVEDLARMPHLLVGGTTGSGKSVAINTMILSLLYKCDPEQIRLVLIDPKTVEFSLYQDIPHLLCPVVTDMNKAANALGWLVNEMDRRYNLMSKLGVRSFDSFNEKVRAAIDAGSPLMDPFDVSPVEPEPHTPLRPLPYIVCFIDELADLILVNRKQVEMLIMRLAQKARAAGMHLVLATQRPSVDIVTPLIKANIVARLCFQVASRFDSQVVLDENGAQDLLGRGDMLFRKPGMNALQRIQGCMVEEEEILRVVEELKRQGTPEYIDGVTESEAEEAGGGFGSEARARTAEQDPLYDEAVNLVIESNRPTISFVQRRFSIGYNRAANLLETMEAAGVVSKPSATGKRDVLIAEAGGGR